jgi:hypothetical protein
MPRADHEGAYSEDDYWTPTYRSRSLLYSEPADRYTQAIDNPATNTLAPAKTFAAMARRLHPSDNEGDIEQLSQSPTPLAGIIKLQTNRREGTSSWRSAEMSSLGEPARSGHNDGHASSSAENLEHLAPVRRSAPSSVLRASPHKSYNETHTVKAGVSAKPEHRDGFTDRAGTVGGPFTLPGSGQESTKTASYLETNDRHELFGDLPDPIRLQEQPGEFDGQVVFIGHPNRDVSAHQWSSASFQWENIGRYAQSRGRVEGSLASDAVKGLESSRNALLHFKLAAESREKIVVEDGRPKEASDTVRTIGATVPRLNTVYNFSRPVAERESIHDQGHASSTQPPKEAATATSVPLSDLIKRMHLDDPFVARPNPVQPNFPDRAKILDVKGSLDLRYEFPVRATIPTRLTQSAVEIDVHERDSALPGQGTRSYMHLAQHALPEIGFGEEASSGPQLSLGQSNVLRRAPKPYSPDRMDSRLKSKDPVVAYDEHTKRMDAAIQARTVIPRFDGLQPTARSLFPPIGLTIANPHRVVSRLDPTAPAHKSVLAPSSPLKFARSDTTATDLTTAAALQFSDPDGLRQTRGYEVANGLNKQPPTVQNFKGPFFTDSQPTANDPTLSLSVHVSEAAKLKNWFRDGYRLDRQREYARTLMSTAESGSRNPHPGTIGEATGSVHNNEIQNTLPFVRLYESLSEYIEEYRNGSGGSYFTRAWTVASPQLRDLGPDGNNSFFSDAGVVPVEVRPRTSRWYQKDRAQHLNVFPSSGGITERLSSHGTVGDGGLGLGKKGARVSIR